MPVDLAKYQQFLVEQAQRLESFKFDPSTLLWHYTNGQNLLKILESGTLYSTQVSCLNDSSEMRYGQTLFKKGLTEALSKFTGDDRVKQFVTRYIKQIDEVNSLVTPAHAPSMFFVTCFTSKEDDLSTWRAYGSGQNGYAIAFRAGHLKGGPLDALVKVNYDAQVHRELANEVVAATLKFYAEGLEGIDDKDILAWDQEFMKAWEDNITYLQPLVKDPAFEAESEYRVLHTFGGDDLKKTVILQKSTMMTRHVPISFPAGGGILPIEKVMIGPCRHPLITKISVDLLLKQKGYGGDRVVNSKRPLQET
jgi:hypothetical protein